MRKPMAVNPVPNQDTPATPAKAKRKRSPSVARPAFFVIQILDDANQPIPFDKRHVKLVSVERNAEVVMELMENGSHPNAFYIRGIVPVARPQRASATPAQAHAA